MLVCRMPIVKAGRGWRQGVKTYVAWEQEINVDLAAPAFKVRGAGQTASEPPTPSLEQFDAVSAGWGIWGQAPCAYRAAG